MTLYNSITSGFGNIASVHGTTSRKEYWPYACFATSLASLPIFVDQLLIEKNVRVSTPITRPSVEVLSASTLVQGSPISGLLTILGCVLFLILLATASTRRLHDANEPNEFLIFFGISFGFVLFWAWIVLDADPLARGIMAVIAMAFGYFTLLFSLLSAVACVIAALCFSFLIYQLCLPSRRAPNLNEVTQ